MPMTPARRVTLAIIVPVALAAIGWGAFSLIASLGSSSFSFSAPLTAPGGKLTADFPSSDVTVVPGGTAKVAGTASYSLVRPHLTVSDGKVSYHCPVPTGTCGLTATLTVPAAATSMSVSTGGGDLTVANGITIDATLTTSSGNIMAAGLTGTANLDSGGGNVDASGITAARMTVDSDSGDVTLRFADVPGHVLVNSGGGDVRIVLPRGDYNFQVSAVGGTASRPASDPGARDVIVVNSDSGNITVLES
jgi:Putative adhesin